MKRFILFLTLLLNSLVLFPIKPVVAQSTVNSSLSYFKKSPRLTNVMTTFNAVRVWSATYYFTIEMPKDAGNTLSTIAIQQRAGYEEIDFYLDKTVAFLGNHRNKKDPIAIESITQDPNSQVITLTLASPIPSDTVFTIGLKPKRNPDVAGVYLFGVTVYPTGNNPSGLYLGAGRLHFYRGGDGIY
ncbi:MAG: DUF2808 domain-containing protein [Microcystaceae cyanobacterium]